MLILKIVSTGIDNDGGCLRGIHMYTLASWTGCAEMPEQLDPVIQAALLLCAGVTVFNAMRNQEDKWRSWPFGNSVCQTHGI